MKDRWTPVFRVSVAGGGDITGGIADRLVSLSVTDEAGDTSDAFSLELDDRDAVFEPPPTGATLSVGLGYAETGGPVDMGIYVVDDLEFKGPDRRFLITAKAGDSLDKDAPGRIKAPQSRSWHDKTLGDIVAAIASEHGFEPIIGEDLAKIKVPHVDQTSESDINLLRRLAKQNGAAVKPASGKLVFASTGTAKTATGQAMPRVALSAAAAESWSMKIAKRGAAQKIKAQWHDAATGKLMDAEAGDGEPVKTLRHTYASKAEAEQAAAAAQKNAARGERTFTAAVRGDPALVAEAPLTLSGFRLGVDGEDWVITRAEHRLDAGGYKTSITAAPVATDGA